MGFLDTFFKSYSSAETQQVHLQNKVDRSNELLEKQLKILERKESKEAEEAREKRIAFFGEEEVLEMERRERQRELERGPTPEQIEERHERERELLSWFNWGGVIVLALYLYWS